MELWGNQGVVEFLFMSTHHWKNAQMVSSQDLRAGSAAKKTTFFEKSPFFFGFLVRLGGHTHVHLDMQGWDLEENPCGQGPCPRSQDGKEPKHAQENT